MMKVAEMIQTMREYPIASSLILLAVIGHILVMIYGFMLLAKGEQESKTNSRKNNSKGSFLSGKMERFADAGELKKMKDFKSD